MSKPGLTNPSSAFWTIDVSPSHEGYLYSASAKLAANVATQALYDALVGKRVLLDLTAGIYTVDTTVADSAANGVVIMDVDVSKYPGKVAFTVRAGCSVFA